MSEDNHEKAAKVHFTKEEDDVLVAHYLTCHGDPSLLAQKLKEKPTVSPVIRSSNIVNHHLRCKSFKKKLTEKGKLKIFYLFLCQL